MPFTAYFYGCEPEVGQAIRDSGIPREKIWVTTKLDNQSHNAASEALEMSLLALRLDYIDLYLMHWPCPVDPHDSTKLLAGWSVAKTWYVDSLDSRSTTNSGMIGQVSHAEPASRKSEKYRCGQFRCAQLDVAIK